MTRIPAPRPEPRRRRTGLLLGVGLALALSACGSDGGAEPSEATDSTATAQPSAAWTTDAAGERRFVATDYTYRLLQICYCPPVGPVEVTVVDGEVAETSIVRGPDQGKAAPRYYEVTIADLLTRGEQADAVEVTWPDDQDWPSVIAIDQLERAVDDEITYRISDVRFE